jgi:hypothetical protein
MALTEMTRRRLHVQGFESVPDADLARVERWLRLTPALCGAIVAVGTVLAAPGVLFALAVIAALGGIFPVHPFDLAYNYGLRHLTGTPPLPRNGAPRRFACAIASAWITAAGLAFLLGAPLAGYVLGGMFVAVAALLATTQICVPSMVFRAGCRMAGMQPA